jgi:hypothetical protein
VLPSLKPLFETNPQQLLIDDTVANGIEFDTPAINMLEEVDLEIIPFDTALALI